MQQNKNTTRPLGKYWFLRWIFPKCNSCDRFNDLFNCILYWVLSHNSSKFCGMVDSAEHCGVRTSWFCPLQQLPSLWLLSKPSSQYGQCCLVVSRHGKCQNIYTSVHCTVKSSIYIFLLHSIVLLSKTCRYMVYYIITKSLLLSSSERLVSWCSCCCNMKCILTWTPGLVTQLNLF